MHSGKKEVHLPLGSVLIFNALLHHEISQKKGNFSIFVDLFLLGNGRGDRIAAYPSYGLVLPDGTSSLPNNESETIKALLANRLPERWAHQNTGNLMPGIFL